MCHGCSLVTAYIEQINFPVFKKTYYKLGTMDHTLNPGSQRLREEDKPWFQGQPELKTNQKSKIYYKVDNNYELD